MSENQTGQHIGVEAKILHIVKVLRQVHPFGKYEMAFHQDRYNGEAFYDRTLESIEDVGSFRVRFADKSSVDIPVDAILEWDRPDFIERWGEAIMATKR